MSILFTQYKLPRGQREHVTFDATPEIEEKAHALLDHGFHFDVELLMTGMVSMTCEYTSDYTDDVGPVAIEISPNGPGIDQYVNKLVTDAYDKWQAEPETFSAIPSNWRTDLQVLEEIRKEAAKAWDF